MNKRQRKKKIKKLLDEIYSSGMFKKALVDNVEKDIFDKSIADTLSALVSHWYGEIDGRGCKDDDFLIEYQKTVKDLYPPIEGFSL